MAHSEERGYRPSFLIHSIFISELGVVSLLFV